MQFPSTGTKKKLLKIAGEKRGVAANSMSKHTNGTASDFSITWMSEDNGVTTEKLPAKYYIQLIYQSSKSLLLL